MAAEHRTDRRAFLRLATAVAATAGSTRSLDARQGGAPEAIPGSPRWPGSFRAGDFYSRSSSLDEIIEVSRRIPDGDLVAYESEWAALRDRALADARALERDGRLVSAGEAYLRASNYSNRVYNLFLRLGDRTRGVPAYRKTRDLFDTGTRLLEGTLPFERITIPYKGGSLKGFFFPMGRPGRQPAVYRTGGADSVKESNIYSSVWAPFVHRGVSCLVIDAPGQGEALNLDGFPLRADFERVVTAVVDHLAGRPDVDPGRIGVYGTSMGGYFAGRGAAFEPRLRAVVLQSVWYDVLHDSYEFCPSFRPHLRYMVDADGDARARELLAAFTFEGLGPRITQPIAIAHGEMDDVVRVQGARRLAGEIASSEKQFTVVRGARHNLDTEVSRLTDWFCGRLTRA